MVLAVKVVLYLLLCSLSIHAWGTPIRMALVHYPPYTNQDTVDQGFIPQLLRKILMDSEFTLETSFLPHARARDMIKRGTADAISYSTAPHPNELTNSLHAGVPLFYLAQYNFLYDSRRFPQGVAWQNFSEIENKTIGTIIQFPLISEFKQHGLSYTTQASQIGLMKQLFKGRIDLWAVPSMTGAYLLQLHFPEDAAFIKRTSGRFRCCVGVLIGISDKFSFATELAKLIEQRYIVLINNGWALRNAEQFYGQDNVPNYFLPTIKQIKSRAYKSQQAQ